MLLFYVGIFATTCEGMPHGMCPAMIKKGVSMISWGMHVMILAPSLKIMQLSFLSSWNETPNNMSMAELGFGYKISASPFCIFMTQSNPFKEVFKPHLPEFPANFL